MTHPYKSDPDDFQLEWEHLGEDAKNSAIMNPGHVDEGLWKKAKEISEKSYGELKWPFIMHIYEKLGGK